MIAFLNIDRSDISSTWPEWHIRKDINHNHDNIYNIFLWENYIEVIHNYPDKPELYFYDVNSIKKLKASSSEFSNFLNRRFLLKNIWERFNVPRDLSRWIQITYF